MADNSTLNLMLKIRADLADASRALQGLAGDVEDVGTAATGSSQKLDTAARAQENVAESARGQAQAEQSAAAAASQTGDAVQQAATDYAGYQAAIARTRAEMGSLQSGMDGTTADIDAQRAALAALVNRIDPVVAAYGRLDDMQEQLSTFRGAGLVGDDDFEQYSSRLNELRLQVEKSAWAATDAGRKEAAAAREAAQAEAQAATAKEQFINRLREQAETLNLTTAELLQYKAAQLGISAEAAPFIQKITDQNAAMSKGGISAGQYAQAMRYLPMQITDVVTSLASGMPVWMVAIQQGGQIKDSFGGIGNTFRALLDVITPARIAMGGVAGILAAIGIAAVSAMNDQEEFNRSIQKTGNYAGVTSGELEQMTQQGGQLRGNYSQVRDILNGLVSSGRFTGETLTSVAQAASLMAELSGQSADQVVSSFLKMSDSATSWAANTNQQYHFLDLETYQRIQSLEDQGRKEEAIELASQAFKKASEERLRTMEQQLNRAARAWNNVKIAATGAWESFKDKAGGALGLDTPADELTVKIKELEAKIAAAGSDTEVAMQPREYQESVKRYKEDLAALKEKQQAEEKAIAAEAKRKQTDAESIAAAEKLQKLWKGNRSEVEKEADAVEEIRKNYETLWKSAGGRDMLQSRGVTSTDGKNFSGGQWDTDTKALDKSGQKVEQYNKQLQQTLNQKKAITELDRVEAEIRNGSLSEATKAQQNEARALAKKIDAANEANKATKEAQSQAKQQETSNKNFVKQLEDQASKRTQGAAATRAQEIATRNLTAEQRRQAEAANAAITAQEFKGQNLQLQLEYMRDTGDTAGASMLELRNRVSDLRREFEASGNTQGLNWLDKLLPVAETKIRVDDLRKQLDDLFTYQSQQETSIQAQVQGGLLSEIQGRQRLVSLHQEVGDKIKGYLPQLKELANAPGEAGDKIREMIRQLEEQLGKLNQAGHELTQAFRDGLQSGIESSLMGLAKGTMNLRDAVKNLALTIINSMAQLASQQLAQMATSALVGSSGGVGGLLGSLASVFAADGGQVRGPGSTTSDSIPAMLSDKEYVVRASVVQQPGALAFLHDYNRHGMAALEGWLPRARHATGGLAGIPAQNMPVPASVPETAMATPSVASQQPVSLQQQLLFDAGDAYTAGALTLAGQRVYTTQLKANVPTLKQWLGLNK
ncbi:TPA: phage tail length tape measure family protein [Klebsiella pneumoniae]|uniref:phage tail length tape measure family protein n=1 Tax=Klebsiella pneumoniae complex TaxID=3390273 RepID=UPI001CDA6865|nr:MULTISPECIES: phage tail length tape measure family protein [Klebsiella]EIX9611401.1 phage tail length tape measure family protein [Klebsiella pneumoniae]EJC6298674.1 phage tail length tape measure family protein [Klebsiella pneumoniae]MDT9854055.1 phage tail length tape measure family protein [Klebsiella pneumoniae]MDU7856236.1 phage tail length tape measure family protein [Klebsiella pneumoniae]HBW4576266.1 phage tail length tape measure family protein [Klebsiella pneumoniae]